MKNQFTDIRKQLIASIIELHNFQMKQHYLLFKTTPSSDSFWSIDQYELKPDRYFLVEDVHENLEDDYDNKTFYPKIELRYHFRSKEKHAYGPKHDYFYKGYKSTTSYTYEELENVEKAKEDIMLEYEKAKAKFSK